MNNLLVGPILLNRAHSIEQFDCGIPALNTYLLKNALQNQQSQGARTYVVTLSNNVMGYFTLAYGSAAPDFVPIRVQKGLGKYPIPLMVLARLAVDKSYHGKGLGKALLKQALLKSVHAAEIAGLRAVLVHAKDESAKLFYQKFGFTAAPFDDYHLYLLIKDIEKNLKNHDT